ncbi:hypothetical protein GRZ55_06545 [Chelativorans sp. ZYF759]|uniref:hypothetical protein n=1 Tax=Chelativorans sp. ZYF759 TaxID=2692213 RepID=UPI00145E2F86|nr:hypothetical protein [Chelativorans sp. ZYF759]NMG38901.1 hypothetical protein [Chelativorans sp. ZYF759]
MSYSYRGFRGSTLFALASIGLAVSACQSGSPLGALGMGSETTAQAQQDLVNPDELRAFCPPVVLRENDATIRNYERGGDGDAARVVYQASVSDISRSCRYDGQTVTATVALAGRVVPGPRGQTGPVTLPIRVVAMHGSNVIYSQTHQYQVQVADTAGATQFVFTDPNVSFVLPPDRGIRIIAGFDQPSR